MNVKLRNISESTVELKLLLYVLLKLQDLKCLWLIKSTDLSEKSKIGLSIGYEKELIPQIHARIVQLFNPNTTPLEPEAFEKNIDSLLENRSIAEACKILQVSLLQYVSISLNSVCELADEPSKIALQQCEAALLKGLKTIGYPKNQDNLINIVRSKQQNTIKPLDKLALPELPGRPNNMRHFNGREAVLPSDSEEIKLAKFLHSIAINIEICAMEVCCYNIVKYAEMPIEFRTDMAQQIWDESRHYILLKDYINKYFKVSIGDYSYNFDVWEMHQCGSNLAEQLAIEQVIQEGDAIGNNVKLIHQLQHRGMHRELQVLIEYINADESMHTKNGNKWLNFICDREDIDYMQTLFTTAEKINKAIPGKIQFLPQVYEFLEFPPEYITYSSNFFESCQ